MLTLESLQEFTRKFQTNERNVVREYIQHLFLAGLYKSKGAEKLLFKGGTALRVVYQSPRFSEDVDFTGQGVHSYKEIDDLFLEALSEVEKIGLDISYKEAKPTAGGYLGVIHYKIFELVENMKFEISLRKRAPLKGELTTIVPELTTPYTLIHLPPKELVSEKMEALLTRRKPRDYYDCYFALRSRELNKLVDKNRLKLVLKNLETERVNFKTELSNLLPISHHSLLPNFKDILKKEIRKYF